jgi:phosphoribosylanthranilate isomerase
VKYALDAEDRAAADAAFTAELRAALTEPEIDAALLDAAQGGASGGLGMAFDWEHVAPLVRRVVDQLEAESGERPRVIVAGGLRVENVERAIALFQPWGVDVASGVEAGPGKKDAARLRAFLEAARAGFATLKG